MSSADKIKEHLLLLFERPTEPTFMPKGAQQAVFDIPQEYLVSICSKIESFCKTLINITLNQGCKLLVDGIPFRP